MRARTVLSILLAFSLAYLPVIARSDSPPQKAPEKLQVTPKFFWGALAGSVLSSVFSVFTSWLSTRLTGGTPSATSGCSPSGDSGSATSGQAASAPQPATLGDAVQELKVNMAMAAVVELANAVMNPSSVSAKSFVARGNVTVGTPITPLKVKEGKANFQGVHIAIVDADPDGRLLGFHSVNQGFRSGERFKLRVLATFDGLLAIDNINPAGVRKRIYPPKDSQVVSLKAGQETVVPLGADEFFEFTGSGGTEQLVIALRDPRAFGNAASTAPVYRRDEVYGSNLVQEVATDTYPAIFQSIELAHQ